MAFGAIRIRNLVVIWATIGVCFSGVHKDEIFTAIFGETYTNHVSSKSLLRYRYHLPNDRVARVRIESNARKDLPLLAVVREQRAIISWQLPLILASRYQYNVVERTLCPLNTSVDGVAVEDVKRQVAVAASQLSGGNFSMMASGLSNQTENFWNADGRGEISAIEVEISTASPTPLNFNLTTVLVKEFELGLNHNTSFHVSASTPVYLKVTMPNDTDTVIVKVDSTSLVCMTVSIQPISCPVFDLDNNVDFIGFHQTVARAGAITVRRNLFERLTEQEGSAVDPLQKNSFYVVFVVKPDDTACNPDAPKRIISPDPGPDRRNKTVNLVVVPSISTRQFVFAILGPLCGFLGVYIFVIGLSLLFYVSDVKSPVLAEERKAVLSSLNGDYGAVVPPGSSLDSVVSSSLRTGSPSNAPSTSGGQPTSSGRHSPTGSEASRGSDDYDRLEDAESDKEVLRSKAKLVVADLARKPYKALDKKYRMYHWNLITISIFYALPVIQFVVSNQMFVVLTGDQDECYFNFRCAIPFLQFMAFNNIFSNIGYVMLGLLFLILVYNRDQIQKKELEQNFTLATKYGIPKHYGPWYAIGLALLMEGVLSACYHVCPNYTNFQFDTAFMYMIGCLGLLSIYQIRHPDINAHSHKAYCLMALVIVISVLGVYEAKALWLWITFSVFSILLMFMVSAEFYYKGNWKINRKIFARIKQEWQTNPRKNCLMPLYPERMFFLLIGNVMNLAFIAFGLIERPKDFSTFLLTIFISNLMLYYLYYVSMKVTLKERIGARPLVYIFLAVACWATAGYFYFQPVKSWHASAALSREKNEDCIFLNFYDSHDVWHFLSALSLFFSFMVVLTIDDDISYVPQDKIAVF